MKFIKLIVVVLLLLLLISQGAVASSSWIHGEIVEVFSAADKLRILIDGEINILEVESDAEILRDGIEISLNSTRPITKERYQDGLFYLNDDGKVEIMIVSYIILEIETSSHTVILYYDIFGKLKDVEEIPSLQKDSTIF